jgi:hypothetical protein
MKVTVPQLLKSCLAFYGTLSTRTLLGAYPEPGEFSPEIPF